METVSKAWDWEKSKDQFWYKPCEESYYLVSRWKEKGLKKMLDLGCGRGRHSILFAKEGFEVSATDLSEVAINGLTTWAEEEGVRIETTIGDMMGLPYEDASFDCLLAYHVISHTDQIGIQKILTEIRRVLKEGAEFYITLCSKNSWTYQKSGFPKLDDNTVVKIEDGPENNVPHFFVDAESLNELFSVFEVLSVRHVQEVITEGKAYEAWHYFILGRK